MKKARFVRSKRLLKKLVKENKFPGIVGIIKHPVHINFKGIDRKQIEKLLNNVRRKWERVKK